MSFDWVILTQSRDFFYSIPERDAFYFSVIVITVIIIIVSTITVI